MSTNSITVSELKTSTDSLLSSSVDAANKFVQEVQDFATTSVTIAPIDLLNIPWIDPFIGFGVSTVAQSQDFIIPTTLPGITATKPDAPTLAAIAIPDFGNIPELTQVSPVITMPSAPSTVLPGAPGTAPAFEAVDIPTAPTITMPVVPTLQNIALPVVPAYTIPTYTPVDTLDDLLDPTTSFSFTEQTYQSDILTALQAKIVNDLANGGYGIEPLDEQSLWERAREREMLAADTAIEQASAGAAARGFQMPPGALLALIEGAQQSALEKISSVNREIALKRADLYVQNRQFTIQQAQQVEQMLITYFGYMMERALNVAKYTAEFGIQIFNARVARFSARLEGARVAAQVYETQLKSALAHLEAYKVEVEGAKLGLEAQRISVDIYSAQLDAVKTYVDIYRTQMEAARVHAEIEKLTLDAFRVSVDAYTAQVGAKAAEFGMYKAQIDGELAKVEVFKAQVGAFESQVGAYGARVSAQKAGVDVHVAAATLQLEDYRAKITAYGAELQKGQIELQALVSLYGARVQKYGARLQAEASAVNTVTAAAKANAEASISKAHTASGHILGSAQALTAQNHLGAQAAVAGLEHYSKVATVAAERASGVAVEYQG